jgi:two-component system, response regulator, stage 0 sporulation protein F
MHNPQVLYVDDENINLMLFEANFENKYKVLTAENGMSGLDILQTSRDVKVVISDMRMPAMNGIEFIRKAMKIAPQADYFILSGFEITSEIQKAIDEGVIRKCFKKPFNLHEIASELDQVLEEG